jgi:hypothetical protein
MIYEKTPLGIQAFQQKPSPLDARLRSILIMIDGKRSSTDLLTVLAAIGGGQDHLDELLALGLIRSVDESSAAAPKLVSKQPEIANEVGLNASVALLTDQQRYEKAYPIATKLTSGLGLRGFRLNLSVEGAGNINDLINLADKIRDAIGDAKFAEIKPYLQD